MGMSEGRGGEFEIANLRLDEVLDDKRSDSEQEELEVAKPEE
jgi:hypothetical protein